MKLRLPFCLFDRHRPKPGSVQWNGTSTVGTCRDCGHPVRRSSKGYWKRLAAAASAAED